MNFKMFFRALPSRTLLSLLLVMMVFATPAICLDSEDSQIFITGFNAYQKKDYQTTVDKMSSLLKTYPDTPLRDMAIFWLARANFKAGHKEDAARYMAQFFKEYPDSPLKGTVEDELVTLAGKYARGESVASAAKGTGEKPAPDLAVKEPSEAEAKAAAQRAEEMRLAVQKAEAEKKASAEKAAAEKAAREKAEAERIAAAKKAEELQIAAEQAAAEKARQEALAAEKAAAEKAAAEKAAQEKAEAERVAAAKKAEEMRIAAEKAAAEKARQEKLAAEKAAAEKAAAEKAAQEKAEAERIAAAKKAEEMRVAAERAAAEKARQEKIAAEKAAAEKAAREKAEAERVAAAKKAEELRIAAEKAAAEKARQEKIAAEKAAAEKAAREKAEAERIAAAKKAEELRIAAEKAAAEKARQEKIAAEKAAAEKAAQEKVEAERVAAAKKAEEIRIVAEKAAAEKARQEKIAAEKAAAEKAAQEKAEAERVAAARKAEEMRLASAEKAAQAEKRSKPASVANGRKKEKSKSSKSATLREKAIAEYKSVIDRFPGSAAAASAAGKLKDLGIVYPVAAAAAVAQGENAKVLSLEVGQFADLDFTLTPPAQALESGKRVTIPFEIVNLGNGTDTFYLESGFPAEFDVQFMSAAQPAHPINVTPQLKTGERYRAVMSLMVPRTIVDGQKAGYPIKVGSGFSPEISQSKELRLSFAAPLLRAVIKAEKNQLQPGQKIAYRLDLLNIGTSSARGVTLRLNYPPQYEPVNLVPAGFKPEMKAALVLDGLQLDSGESKTFNLTFQLKEDALALQELFLRADVINTELEKRDSFISPSTVVAGVSGVSVRTSAEKLVVIPGQTIRVPMVITNTGNIREDFTIKPVLPADVSYSFYQDLNRDGKKQENEPLINHVGPLAPKEEAYVVLEVNTPASQQDGAIMPISVGLEPEADRAKSVALNVRLVYSRPVLDLLMTGKGGKVKPGEVSSFELSCTNRGSNLAKVVDVQTVMPEQLAVVSADPVFSSSANGVYTWRFDDVGSGEKRTIKITYKVKTGTVVGTNMQIKNVLKYQDLLGMNY